MLKEVLPPPPLGPAHPPLLPVGSTRWNSSKRSAVLQRFPALLLLQLIKSAFKQPMKGNCHQRNACSQDDSECCKKNKKRQDAPI